MRLRFEEALAGGISVRRGAFEPTESLCCAARSGELAPAGCTKSIYGTIASAPNQMMASKASSRAKYAERRLASVSIEALGLMPKNKEARCARTPSRPAHPGLLATCCAAPVGPEMRVARVKNSPEPAEHGLHLGAALAAATRRRPAFALTFTFCPFTPW